MTCEGHRILAACLLFTERPNTASPSKPSSLSEASEEFLSSLRVSFQEHFGGYWPWGSAPAPAHKFGQREGLRRGGTIKNPPPLCSRDGS